MIGESIRQPGIALAAVESSARAYRRLARRRTVLLIVLGAVLALSLAFDVSYGPARLSIPDVLHAIFDRGGVDDRTRVIVWEIRLPVALMAILVGAALAMAGAEMQTILNNPLASPFTLGISAAASFGAAFIIVVQKDFAGISNDALVTLSAFAFAMLASMLVFLFSRVRGVSTESMVLVGIALVFLFGSLLALMQYIANEQTLQQIVFWTLGSLARSTWDKVAITALVVGLSIPFFFSQSWKLTALRLGEDKARSLGVNTEQLRLHVLIVVSVLAAVAVAFVGTVGFVGLAGPHIARMLVGEDQRHFLPASAIAGALIMSLTSIASKAILPGVLLPIGIITSLVGIPFFLSLILTRRRQLW